MGWKLHWWLVHPYLIQTLLLPWNLCQVNIANMHFWHGVLQAQIQWTTYCYSNQCNSKSIPVPNTCNSRDTKHQGRCTHGSIKKKYKSFLSHRIAYLQLQLMLSQSLINLQRSERPHLVTYDPEQKVPITSPMSMVPPEPGLTVISQCHCPPPVEGTIEAGYLIEKDTHPDLSISACFKTQQWQQKHDSLVSKGWWQMMPPCQLCAWHRHWQNAGVPTFMKTSKIQKEIDAFGSKQIGKVSTKCHWQGTWN